METQKEKWASVKALFEAALEQDPASRSDYLISTAPTSTCVPRWSGFCVSTKKQALFFHAGSARPSV
jgi:hypothetical protein